MENHTTAITADQGWSALLVMACAAIIWASGVCAYQNACHERSVAANKAAVAQVESDRTLAQERARDEERIAFERLGIY